MSAPQTNIEKQKARHKPALIGLRAVIATGVVLFVGLIVWLAAQGDTPVDPDVKIDGRTGEEVVIE